MTPLRILQVCSAESFGGGERHVVDLARWLAGRGHRVHLAVRPHSPLRAPLSDTPVEWHELGLRGAADLESAWRLARLISRHRIDILHAHVARDYPVCGLAAKMSKADFLLTRHHFNPISGGPLYAWTIESARHLIAVSESVGASLARSFPKLAARIKVISNWIDAGSIATLSRDDARRSLGSRRRLAAAVIGQITPLKRQDLFLRASAQLLRERPDLDLDLFIIGEAGRADESYARRLREIAAEEGIADRAYFTGHLPSLESLYAAFDLVVVPSQNEAFSLVLVEAMAASCGVIATRKGGMAEIVDDGIDGLLIEPDDLSSLAAAMRLLLEDEPLRLRMGEAARLKARQRFARDRVLPRIEALYTRSQNNHSG